MTHDEAMKILEQPPLSEEESKELLREVARKREISEDEVMKFHQMPEFTENSEARRNFIILELSCTKS